MGRNSVLLKILYCRTAVPPWEDWSPTAEKLQSSHGGTDGKL